MQVGDVLYIRPNFYSTFGMTGDVGPRRCWVTYVHPEDRFYVVEFCSDLGVPWRETFYPPARRIRAGGYHDVSSPDVGR